MLKLNPESEFIVGSDAGSVDFYSPSTQSSKCYAAYLVAIRRCIEDIQRKMRKSEWRAAIEDKGLQNLLKTLFELVAPIAHQKLLHTMISSRDPWLWLAGASLIGVDPADQENRFTALLDGTLPLDRFDDPAKFLDCLERLMRSSEFINLYKNNRRTEREVEKSLFALMKTTNASNSKSLVIRLDLSYGKEYSSEMRPELRIKSDWERFLAYFQSAFSTSYLGYVAKFEYGEEKGVHIHTLLLLNGSVVRQDASIGRALGQFWCDQITSGAGIYFNCNTPEYKSRMKNCAIGSFKRGDQSFLVGARALAKYFAKRDPIVAMMIPEMVRTLRRTKLKI